MTEREETQVCSQGGRYAYAYPYGFFILTFVQVPRSAVVRSDLKYLCALKIWDGNYQFHDKIQSFTGESAAASPRYD